MFTVSSISPTVFEQALLYLYGGVTDISKSCSLSELLLVADMYGIEGLKEVISFHLRKEYCHFFHKVCTFLSLQLTLLPQVSNYVGVYLHYFNIIEFNIFSCNNS